MKILSRLLSVCITVVLLMIPFQFSVAAETGSASISVSSTDVNVGDTIVITANYNASNIGCIQAYLYYDASVLEFVSGDNASGSAGVVKIIYANQSFSTISSMKFPLTFQALSADVSKITLSTDEFFSLDNENYGNPDAGVNLTVKDASSNLSSNCNLKSLALSAGTLSPSFSASTTSYTVSVPYETTSITIGANAEDADATFTVNKPDSLSVGSNTVTVSVVAPDGTQKVYTIKITRKSNTTTAEETETTAGTTTTTQSADQYGIEIDGIKYKLVSDLTGIAAPDACFSMTSCIIGNEEVSVYQHNNADVTLVYLLNEANQGAFFIYDQTQGTYYPFVSLKLGDNFYVLLEEPADTTFESYIKSSVTIGDFTIDAWNIPINGEVSDFYLVYAVNSQGETQWYQYDIKEKTMQRTFLDVYQAANSTLSSDLQAEITTLENRQWIYLIVLSVLAVLSCVLIVLLILSWRRHKEVPRHINRW